MPYTMQHATKTDWSEFVFNPNRTPRNGFQMSSARVLPVFPQTLVVSQHHEPQPSQEEILLQEVQAALDEARALMRRQFGPTMETVLCVLEEIDKFSSDLARHEVSSGEVLEVAAKR